MHNSHDEYLEATQQARINQESQKRRSKGSKKTVPILLASFAVLGLAGVGYWQSMAPKSETMTTQTVQNQQYLASSTESLPQPQHVASAPENTQTSSTESQPEHQNYFVVTVKKGDSLASLSKKYFGNEMYFDKILALNKELTKKSILNIGQKINIPR
ncbi:MAG TPA: LysM peptidoglycan-binding domain-containing protein [Campylobacterales bacterium]|nr:LysM peptidoglycan-binding domain-containing protein [Campylobacterales bacterium]